MNKKILASVLAMLALVNTGVSAAYNKYNEEDFVALSNCTIEEAAELLGMSYEELQKEFELPEDMPGDTNEAAAFRYLTVTNFSKLYEEDAAEMVEYIKSISPEGTEVTADTLWKDVEDNVFLKDYVSGVTVEEFKAHYLPDAEVDDTTVYGDVRIPAARAMLEEEKMLTYFTKNDILVLLNGKYVDFDVAPQIINSRTMVPARGVFEQLGAAVNWDDETKTVFVNKDDTVITLQIGLENMFVNSEIKTLDTPAQIVDGRTLVPLRAIAEALDTEVFYNETTKTVVIH